MEFELEPPGSENVKSIKRLFAAFRRSWYVIVCIAAIAGVCAVSIGLLQQPRYESVATLYVTSATEDTAQNAYQGSLASQQRVASYARLVSSDAVLTSALQSSGLTLSLDEARNAVSADTSPQTVILSVVARTTSPVESTTLANAVADAMTRSVAQLETPEDGGMPLAKLTVVTPASPNSEPVAPSITRNLLIALLAGSIVGCLLVAVRTRFDSKIRSSTDLSEALNVPVLGLIPRDSQVVEGGVVDFGAGASPIGEAYRKLRTNLSFLSMDKPPTVFMITSARPDEGKTVTSMNLAAVLAEDGRRVLLIDADLRKPSIAGALGISNAVGLSGVLRGELPFADAAQALTGSVDVLATGELPPNPSEFLASDRFGQLLQVTRETYDYVLVDTSPVLPVTDAVVLSRWVDGVLYVARSSVSTVTDVTSAVSELAAGNAKVLGAVLNCVDFAQMGYYASSTPYGTYGADAEGLSRTV
ncbi:polysaccharide biosynthesis tyrosine autokinase [Gordonia sp. 135]|uniref:polysaccharide biosynthesis tyrosine autokinase n=1 Tax=Gordonia sp. 135 TaxID=2676309 RepID=UPI0012BB1EFA|nr:polysaccharide biosynthesis tyrosine autokinase [Gordonia sp. 135]QGP87140.1 polysaccharide biosynthesis tyrosine autokinase [Gordonia sp. 135]